MIQVALGDKVEVLDDTISGTVTNIEGSQITFNDLDGFEHQYELSELVVVHPRDTIEVSNIEAARAKEIKDAPKQIPKPKFKSKQIPKMEVDLHINQLVPTSKGLSNHDMLNIQLETAKRQLEFAIKKRIQYVVFIHGVGEGILKEELTYLFGRYPVKFYDADYRKYGLGATEVYIFQNP